MRLIIALLLDFAAVNLATDENTGDINNITSLLKLWFRELPDPLFPQSSYQHFMNAASKFLNHILSLLIAVIDLHLFA